MKVCYIRGLLSAACFTVSVVLMVTAGTALAAISGGDDAMFRAIVSGDQAALSTTVTAANVNTSDSYGKTLLLFAIQQKQPQIVELLLSMGANIDRANMNGITPTIATVQMKQNQSLKLLLTRGAATDTADCYGA